MAKRKRRRKPSRTTNRNKAASKSYSVSRRTDTSLTSGNASQATEELYVQAVQNSDDADREQLAQIEDPAIGDLSVNINKAYQARRLFEIQIDKYHQLEKELALEKEDYQKKHQELIERETNLKRAQKEIQEKTEELSKKKRSLEELQQKLTAWENELKEKELIANTGFQALKAKILAEAEESIQSMSERFTNVMRDLSVQQDSFLKQFRAAVATRRKELEEAWEEELELLESERSELTEKRRKLLLDQNKIEQKRKQIELEEEFLREKEKEFEQRVSLAAKLKIDELQQQLRTSDERQKWLTEEVDRLQKLLAQYNDLTKQFGGRSPDELLKQLEQLSRERDELKIAIAKRPSADILERLHELQQEKEVWEADRFDLERKVNELQRTLASSQIAVVQLESLRDEKLALETSNKLLHKALEELRADVEQRISMAETLTPFPACKAMDDDSELQQSVGGSRPADLRKFVKNLQHQIGFSTETKLYYAIEDVRSFVAGLASNYLTIIQGVSGTGKTSLPLAFARAVGGRYKVIEVQAGWRDRQDLLGYYNSFEKKFYESDFLQALYLAQTPAFRDRFFIIVLDEMNLSYPEQYFADLLSVLERPIDNREITLMTAPAPEGQYVPRLLAADGRTIKIPENVRFIGTANQDETTKDIADKTYDRAHIMELPIKRPQFKLQKPNSRMSPVSYSNLTSLFDKAKRKFADDAKRSNSFLENNLREELSNSFRIGWGLRLQRQINSYVPVVIASGGTIGEATDYILAMKVLRKLQNRFDVDKQSLQSFKDLLESNWPELDDNQYSDPKKSFEIIESILRKL